MNPKKPRPNCLFCGKECKRAVDIYCSYKCQHEYAYQQYIARWLRGEEPGTKGSFFAISDYVRRWLKEKHGERCSECGWAKRHLLTGRIPLTIDHIDGDVSNNRPENLRLLCPNCHALTDTYGALNRGNGKRPHHKGGYLTRNK
jgi:hypothetical protein